MIFSSSIILLFATLCSFKLIATILNLFHLDHRPSSDVVGRHFLNTSHKGFKKYSQLSFSIFVVVNYLCTIEKYSGVLNLEYVVVRYQILTNSI